MTAHAPHLRRAIRLLALGLGTSGLLALAGCKSSDKEAPGAGAGVGVGRKADPLMAREGRLIPKQDLPVPERGVGTKGKADPLTTPTGGRGEKSGYSDDPERFKGSVIPGKGSTPAALSGRIKDGDELKIESPGVALQPSPGVLPADAGEGVSVLFDKLEKLGIKREDRTLDREGNQYVFRASKQVNADGARRQFSGQADSAYEAVKQVLDQIAADR